MKATYYVCSNYIQEHYRRAEHDHHTIEQLLSHQPHHYGTLYTSVAEDSFAERDILLTLEQSLSEEDCDLLKAFCLDNMTVSEISSKTGRSETAIRVRIYRIRKLLEKIFVMLVIFLASHNI